MSSLISQTCPVTNTEVSFWVDEFGNEMLQAKDVFLSLGLNLTNVSVTLERHIFPDYRRKVAIGVGHPAWFLTYEGLVQLVMTTNSLKAREFQRWVFGVIKSIIKTGQYTATESDQQYFEPFGITLQRKIVECDRAIATASITTGEIGKIAASRKVLEKLYKETPKAKAEDTCLQRFIAAYRDKFGDNEFIPSELCRKVQASKSGPLFGALKDICFVYGTKQFFPNLLGKFLQGHQDVVVDGWKIQKLTRSKDGQRWAVVKA